MDLITNVVRSNLRVHVIIALSVALPVASVFSPALGASFDCEKASTDIEMAICDSAPLSLIDEEMGNAFRLALDRFPDSRSQLVSDQRKWLDFRNRTCVDQHTDCLIRETQNRLQAIGVLTSELPTLVAAGLKRDGDRRVTLLEVRPTGLTGHYEAQIEIDSDRIEVQEQSWIVNCGPDSPQVLPPENSSVHIRFGELPKNEERLSFNLWWTVCRGQGMRFSPKPYEKPETIPAVVSVSNDGGLLNTRCHMDHCGWFVVEHKRQVASSPHGQLYEVILKQWSSHHENGTYEISSSLSPSEERRIFVYCSYKIPSVLFPIDDKWLSIKLAPGCTDSIFGYNEGAYVIYYAACHDVAIETTYIDGVLLGRDYGYKFDEINIGQEYLDNPYDIYVK